MLSAFRVDCTAALTVAVAILLTGAALLKRHQRRGRLAPRAAGRLLLSRRTWEFLGLGGACSAWALLALAGPIRLGRWEVHPALLSPLLAGVLLGGKRGALAQLAAALVLLGCPGRFGGALVSAGSALRDPEFSFLVGFVAVPAVVSATLSGRRRCRVGWAALALLQGVAAVYVVAFGALVVGHASLSAGASAGGALRVFAGAALVRLPGDAGLLAAALGAASLLGVPAARRRRAAQRAAALDRAEREHPACERLVLRGVADLLAQEEARLQQRSDAHRDDPLVARLLGEVQRLRQSMARRIRYLEAEAPDLDPATAEFRRLLTDAYLDERYGRLLATLRIFRTAVPSDAEESRPDLKAALEAVGHYFAASTGGAGASEASSPSQRRDLAARLKRQMETDYRARAEEVADLARQAEDLGRDLKALRDLWQAGIVSTALWTAQQRASAELLQTTHRQIDLRRRLLSIYRRAEPPLDLA